MKIESIDKEKIRLEMEITELILQVADISEEVSRSDLQGIAHAKATDIINIIRTREAIKHNKEVLV